MTRRQLPLTDRERIYGLLLAHMACHVSGNREQIRKPELGDMMFGLTAGRFYPDSQSAEFVRMVEGKYGTYILRDIVTGNEFEYGNESFFIMRIDRFAPGWLTGKRYEWGQTAVKALRKWNDVYVWAGATFADGIGTMLIRRKFTDVLIPIAIPEGKTTQKQVIAALNAVTPRLT